MQRTGRGWGWLVAGVMLASLALSLWYGWSVPLGEGPDEPGHLDYTLYLLRELALPGGEPPLDQPGEAHQPPLAYLAALPLALWLPPDQRRIELGENPRWTWRGGDDPAAYFRRSVELLPPRGLTLAWRLLRGWSALLGALTIGLTYLLGRRLGASRGVALGASALLAALPQFAFQHGLVSNDPLLWLLSTATLVWLVPSSPLEPEAGSRKPVATQAASSKQQAADNDAHASGMTRSRGYPLPASSDEHHASGSQHPALESTEPASRFRLLASSSQLGWALVLGLLVGAALLTKLSALALLPVVATGLWLRWCEALLTRPWRSAALAALAALAVSGWWFWRNLRLYGDPLGLQAFQEQFAGERFDPGSAAQWASAARALGTSLVARFGWANLPAPPAIYWLLSLLALAGLLGALLGLRRGARPSRWVALAGLQALLACCWLGAFVATAGQVGWQGRFLFPALPPLALLLSWGLSRLPPARLWLPAAALALALAALALPSSLIRPAYAAHTIVPQPQLPSYGRFAGSGEQGVELRQVGLPAQARAGTTLPVTLTWHVLRRPGRNWSVFVHLARPGQELELAASDRDPFDGAFPMLAWTSEDWIRDLHPLALPAGLPAGSYLVRVGLFDRAGSGERAGLYDGARLIGEYVETGPLEVQR